MRLIRFVYADSGSAFATSGLYRAEMDSETIAATIVEGGFAEWRRLRDTAAVDPYVFAQLLAICRCRIRMLQPPATLEPFECWLAYAESVMDRDFDHVVLREVFADARGFYSPT